MRRHAAGVGLVVALLCGAAGWGCSGLPVAGRGAAADAGALASSRDPGVPADPGALCSLTVEVEDAMARGSLAALRERLRREALAPPSAAQTSAWFAATLALDNPAARLVAFAEEARVRPERGVGELGVCLSAATAEASAGIPSACDAAQARAPTAAVVEAARARAWRRRGALDAALGAIDRAAALGPACPLAHVERARILDARGEIALALAAWARAAELFAPCFLCALESARLAEETQGPGASIPLWEKALALEPRAPEVHRRYGAALAAVDPVRALEAYERAIAFGDATTTTLFAAAQLAAAQGETRKALGFADRVVQRQPVHLDGWRLVLELALRTSDPSRVREAARELLRLTGEDIGARLALARGARAAGDLVEAVKHYEQARRALAGLEPRAQRAAQPAGEAEALEREHQSLLQELKIKGPPPRGTAPEVLRAVQTTAERLFVQRLQQLPAERQPTFRGTLDVEVAVASTGVVDDVNIIRDTLQDPVVAASVVGHLQRATIAGGARRYAFQLEFQ